MASALLAALGVQYAGIDIGYDIGYDGCTRSAETTWPFFADVAFVLEWIFGLLFTAELLLKCAALRRRLIASAWNWLDIIAVLGWWVERGLTVQSLLNPMIL